MCLIQTCAHSSDRFWWRHLCVTHARIDEHHTDRTRTHSSTDAPMLTETASSSPGWLCAHKSLELPRRVPPVHMLLAPYVPYTCWWVRVCSCMCVCVCACAQHWCAHRINSYSYRFNIHAQAHVRSIHMPNTHSREQRTEQQQQQPSTIIII